MIENLINSEVDLFRVRMAEVDGVRKESMTSTTPSTTDDYTSSNTFGVDESHSSGRLPKIREHGPLPSENSKAWPPVARLGVGFAGICAAILVLSNLGKLGLEDSDSTMAQSKNIGSEISLRIL